ncbi:MAG: biotin--[acetyl-CoA-carboxylase] ligase [Deltaproteobacteria bacterium]|nr:biotin--[acetyl-CoA-carboxylase] ligase [Deltaproteobacteria bacterium]MBW1948430.1 biotin--[acetyl-CoA-carboxylase] ligase [Deltaproteobacteria bacterium]MBW2347430.1 biotin--[acetyl-CoA-carboxylase] ligase [Deltaproteobacteria bacterium]
MKQLSIPQIEAALGPSLFNRNLVYRESLDSTNRLARDLASRGAPEGTVVLCDEQTAGRGRLGRRWESPKNTNLLVSLVMRPPLRPAEVFRLTMILALAAVAAAEEVCGVSPGIKWPNDLYVEGKKLGGILTEFSAAGSRVESVVLGLGLNVNWHPEEGLSPSVSLAKAAGREIAREPLLTSLLLEFESNYASLGEGALEALQKRWNEKSATLGRTVKVEVPGGMVQGVAQGIDRDGALVLREPGGREQRILCGDVFLVRPTDKA